MRGDWLGWDNLDTDGTAILDDNLVGLRVGYKVKVLVDSAGGVNVCGGGIGSATSVTDLLSVLGSY